MEMLIVLYCIYRADLDPEEYEEVHKDTMEQLNEFQQSLSRMTSGDMTLVDSFNAMQLVRLNADQRISVCSHTEIAFSGVLYTQTFSRRYVI